MLTYEPPSPLALQMALESVRKFTPEVYEPTADELAKLRGARKPAKAGKPAHRLIPCGPVPSVRKTAYGAPAGIVEAGRRLVDKADPESQREVAQIVREAKKRIAYK